MFGLNLLWIKIAFAAVLAGLLYGGFLYVKNLGYAEAEAIYKPKLEALEQDKKDLNTSLRVTRQMNADLAAQFDILKTAYADQDRAMVRLKELEFTSRKARDAALAELARTKMVTQTEIARLRSIVAGPAATNFEQGCRDAEAELRSLVLAPPT